MAGLNVYNAGLNGSQSDETADIVRYIAAHGPKVRRIVWSVDFEEFFRGPENLPEFYQSVFGGASPWRGRIMHAFSYEALRKTASGLLGGQAFYIDTSGFYHYGLQAKRNLLAGDDFYELPAMRAWFPAYMFLPRDIYPEQIGDRLPRIEAAIRFARAHGVAVDVVLPPMQVSRRALVDLLGYAQRFGEWKKALWGAIEACSRGPGAPVRAFDFTEIGPVALHTFERGGPLDRSPYFFEVLHFRPSVGDMIAARLLDRPWPAKIPPFGAPLQETIADARLAADRAAVVKWEKDNPALTDQIRALIVGLQGDCVSAEEVTTRSACRSVAAASAALSRLPFFPRPFLASAAFASSSGWIRPADMMSFAASSGVMSISITSSAGR